MLALYINETPETVTRTVVGGMAIVQRTSVTIARPAQITWLDLAAYITEIAIPPPARHSEEWTILAHPLLGDFTAPTLANLLEDVATWLHEQGFSLLDDEIHAWEYPGA